MPFIVRFNRAGVLCLLLLEFNRTGILPLPPLSVVRASLLPLPLEFNRTDLLFLPLLKVIEMAPHLETIYVSGWQCSSTASTRFDRAAVW